MMKKRIVCWLAVLALLGGLLPGVSLTAGAAASGSCGASLTWSLDAQTGTLTISGSGPMTDYSYMNPAPWHEARGSIRALSLPAGLKTVGSYAFFDCAALTAVTIPNGVTAIGEFAFASTGLTAVSIPGSVVTLGSAAFSYCTGLASLTLASGLKEIGGMAFAACALTQVTLPASLRTLGGGAFLGCASLGAVTLNEGLERLEGEAFSGCSALTALRIPASVKSVGDGAFLGCSSLEAIRVSSSNPVYASVGGLLYTKDLHTLLQCPGGFAGELQLSAGLTAIGSDAFADCTGLTGLSLPAGLTSIGPRAFRGCTGLRALTIPQGVQVIGMGTFQGCTALASLAIPASVNTIEWLAFTGVSLQDLYFGGSAAAWEALWNQPSATRLHLNAPNPAAHWTMGAYVASPSCTEPGSARYTCPCGYEKTDAAPALGHNWDKGTCLRCGYAAVSAAEVFSDVKGGSWYDAPVLWAIQNGVTSGTGENTFSPTATCTRAQVMTFLYAASGSPALTDTENPFTDVAEGKYYYAPVLWAYHHDPQITGGATETTFGVKNPCKREQVVTFLWKAAGAPEPETQENPFEDVDPNKYYYKAILWAVENGVTSGMTETTFGVGKTCTRAQIVTFLFAACAE